MPRKKTTAKSPGARMLADTKAAFASAGEALTESDDQTIAVRALKIALANDDWLDRTAKKVVAAGNKSPAYRYDPRTDLQNHGWLIAEFPPATPPLTFRTLINLSGGGSVVRFEDPYIRHV